MPAPTSANATEYDRLGMTVITGLIGAELADFLGRYLLTMAANEMLELDQQQVIGSGTAYGDATFNTLLSRLAPAVAAVVGRPVVPSYSFARLYLLGHELEPHIDRPACEHSVSIHLAAAEPAEPAWPLVLVPRRGDPIPARLAAGDAVVYQGCDLEHWREPLPQEWYAQVFLHYVDPAGPHADHVHDRLERPAEVRPDEARPDEASP